MIIVRIATVSYNNSVSTSILAVATNQRHLSSFDWS